MSNVGHLLMIPTVQVQNVALKQVSVEENEEYIVGTV
jgi:hypothetical protein